MRQQLGYLYNCMKVAGPDYKLSPEAISKMFSSNGAALMANTKAPKPGRVPGKVHPANFNKHPKPVNSYEYTGMTAPEAKAFMRFLFTLQWQENQRISGADAPPLEEFLPKDFQG